MHYALALVTILFVAFNNQIDGRTELSGLLVRNVEKMEGFFALPTKTSEKEIYRRTSSPANCGTEIQNIFNKKEKEWTFSIVLIYDVGSQGNETNNESRSMLYKMHNDEISFGLAYFSTLSWPQSPPYMFTVDSFEMTNKLITLKRDQDYLMIKIEGCEDRHIGISRKVENGSPSSLSSWYPNEWSFAGCDDDYWNQTTCELLYEYRCQLERLQGDICYRHRYEGEVFDIRMNILTMTGIFRDLSLIEYGTPIKSLQGTRFLGKEDIGVAFPCLLV